MTAAMGLRLGRLIGATLLAASLVIGVGLTWWHSDLQGIVFFISYVGTGAYLVVRRSRHVIGWLLLLTGWGLSLGSVRVDVPATVAGTTDTLGEFLIWSNGCGWALAFLGIYGICLTFPSGSLPKRRWRRPGQVLYAVLAGIAVVQMVGPVQSIILSPSSTAIDVPNPLAVAPDAAFWSLIPGPDELYALMFAIVLVGFVGLVVRSRTAEGVARLQYRWLVAAVALVGIGTAIWASTTFVLQLPQAGLPDIAVIVTYPSVPIAIAVAVLRYRLYELDRIISRTIAYSATLVVLAVVFAAAIISISALLGFVAQGRSIAVAGATLVAFAAAQPVARTVRTAVDRRFDRARYDAERTTISFADRLRTETDVDAVTGDLIATARATVAPTASSVWIR